MQLRDYQEESLRLLREHYNSGSKKALLVLPAGAGKTTVFTKILEAFSRSGRPGLMVVRGRKLVAQASARLSAHGVSHGVIMGSNPTDDLIQAASIDTLYSRRLNPPADIIVIDEAHAALSESFQWLYQAYPDAFILAVTATPFNPVGFRAIADVIIRPVTVRELTDAGYLVPVRYFVPSRVDLSSVKKAAGEYVLKDLGEAMNQARLIGPIVETWKARGEGRPTLCFCVNIAHSKRMRDEFISAGVKAMHLDAHASLEERDRALNLLLGGGVSIICSVGILTTGVDLPPVSCIVMARPTLSYPIFVQSLGRGTRPFPGKRDLLYFDHANNTETHGFFEHERIGDLDGKIPPFRVVTKTCLRCYCTWEPNSDPACPGLDALGTRCGFINPPKPIKARLLESDDSIALEEIDPIKQEEIIRERWIDRTARECAESGFKKGAAFYKIKTRYGDQIARASWSRIHSAYKVEDPA